MPEPNHQSRPWPGECTGAISLTFDDGMVTQLTQAVPLLDRYGLQGTFYLNPIGKRWEDNKSNWQEVAGRGHEMGNHSLSHICSRGFLPENGAKPGLEGMAIADIEADIVAAEEKLRIAFPDQPQRSFAYPCYMDHVGEGKTRQSYVPIIAKHFVAARGRGEVGNFPATCDLHYLWSWPSERLHAWTLIGMAEKCAAEGRWGIFTFHGIGEGHLPIASYDLEELCKYLAHWRDRIWTAPVFTVAERITQWHNA